MSLIKYKGGYKYQLKADYTVDISIRPDTDIRPEHGYIALDSGGTLFIRKGYSWDGPSGPALDTRNFMRGSLVHDALYQLMRDGLLDRRIHREPADRLLQEHCLEDGMAPLRAWWVYHGVRIGGSAFTDPDQKRPVVTAPG